MPVESESMSVAFGFPTSVDGVRSGRVPVRLKMVAVGAMVKGVLTALPKAEMPKASRSVVVSAADVGVAAVVPRFHAQMAEPPAPIKVSTLSSIAAGRLVVLGEKASKE